MAEQLPAKRNRAPKLRIVDDVTPLTPVELPAHRDIRPWLDTGILPHEVAKKLTAALRMGVRKTEDIAELLMALRGTGVTREYALTVIGNAEIRAVQRWVGFRAKGTEPVDPDAGVEAMHPARFCDHFLVTVGWELQRVIERGQQDGAIPVGVTHERLTARGTKITELRGQPQQPADPREHELAELRRTSTWAIRGCDVLTHGDLVQLAGQFPSFTVADIRRALVDAFASCSGYRERDGVTTRKTVGATQVLDAATKKLLIRQHGKAIERLREPVALDSSGKPMATDWVAVPKSLFDRLLATPCTVGQASSYLVVAWADVVREVEHDCNGLTWREYGQGLQEKALVALEVYFGRELQKAVDREAERLKAEEARKENAKRQSEYARAYAAKSAEQGARKSTTLDVPF